MNKILKTTIGCFFMVYALAGCTDNEEIMMPEDCLTERTQLQFVMYKQLPGGITRTGQTVADGTYSTSFSDGDEVGIFVYNAGDAGTPDANALIGKDVRYRYVASKNEWEPVSEPISLPRDWEKVNVYAYYPATSTAVDDYMAISHSIQSNQSKVDNYALSDFLVANIQLENIGSTSAVLTSGADDALQVTAKLNFSHVCALLEVTVNNSAVEPYSGVQPTVTLLSAKSGMQIDLSADRTVDGSTGLTATDSSVGVAMLPIAPSDNTAASWKFCAVVPPQIIAGETDLLKIVFRPQTGQGGVYTYTLPTTTTLQLLAGKLRKVSVTISSSSAGVANASE